MALNGHHKHSDTVAVDTSHALLWCFSVHDHVPRQSSALLWRAGAGKLRAGGHLWSVELFNLASKLDKMI